MIILHLLEIALLLSILVLVIRIYRKENKTLAEIDDLHTAVAGLSSELTDLADAQSKASTEIEAGIARITTPGISPAEVETAAQAIAAANISLKTSSNALRESAAKLDAALNPQTA